MIYESRNVQTTPIRTYCKRSRPLPYCNPNCRALEVYPSTIAPPDHPYLFFDGCASLVLKLAVTYKIESSKNPSTLRVVTKIMVKVSQSLVAVSRVGVRDPLYMITKAPSSPFATLSFLDSEQMPIFSLVDRRRLARPG